MTAQTISFLKTSEFTLSGAPGRIVVQYQHDVIDTLAARTPVYYVNSPEYGGVGNGSSNPASTRYGTLAALQAFYGTTVGGVTIALTNELDWLAHQKAIDIATAGSGGAIISSSAFSYVMSNANSATDGSGTLVFPVCNVTSPGAAVSWIGENQGGTLISWPTDLGTGKFAVTCSSRATQSSLGEFSNLTIRGPGVGSTLNASTCNMQGIATADRRNINKCQIAGFNYNINVVGGQFLWYDVYSVGGFYGIYFDVPSTINFGNMQFIRVVSQSHKKAALAINGSTIVGPCGFLTCFFGGNTPYSIFKEIGNGGAPTVTAMNDVVFEQTQFEAFGNAALSDANAATTPASNWAKVIFNQCQFSWDAGSKIAALPAAGVFAIGNLTEMEVNQCQSVSSFVPGSTALIVVSSGTGLRVTGDVAQIIANCVGASGGTSVNQFINNPFSSIRFVDFSGWEGGLCFNNDTVAVVGSVVTQTNLAALEVTATGGATTDCPIGVLMYNPTPGIAASSCIYADRGIVTVKSSGTTFGKWLRTAAAGASVPATSSADVTTPMIGYGVSAVATGTCSVKLKGLM